VIDQSEMREVTEPKKKSVWPLLVFVIVLLAAGAGILALLDGSDTTTAANEPLEVEPVALDTGGQPDIVVETPTFIPSDEPVADAAEVILPSVVQIQTTDGVGSGVVYDSDGLILTAAHVVAGENTVTVRLSDGEEIEGTVIGGDADFDVAVVEVDRTGLPAASLALASDPRVGQLAIAVGSPWDLEGTVTAGIISAVNQSIGSQAGFRSVLQTDAAINPGNSGGPLVDRYGQVLGINVSIFSLSGANDGVGFAVPIDVAYDIAQAVISGESLESAFLGVVGSGVDSGQAGALIAEVTPGSGADEGGVMVDDLVIEIDGVTVQGIDDLAAQVRSHRPGTSVELLVIRGAYEDGELTGEDGEEITLTVTLGERPPNLEG
jgi:S1-C subfamily serine protease